MPPPLPKPSPHPKISFPKKLGLIRPLVEAYRDVGKENVEALVRIAYDKDMAEQVSINTIKEELKKKSEDLHQKLDNLLNLSGN
jgi:hypothetical protein